MNRPFKRTHTGQCLRCGQCCSTLYVKLSRREISDRAVDDEARGLSILESDALFLMRYGIPLSPEEAGLRSPTIIYSPHWPQAEYWTCQFHRKDGLCQLDILQLPKPHICKGYPWYNGEPRMKWLYPGCGYQADLLGMNISQRMNRSEKEMPANPDDMELSVTEVVDYTRIKGIFSGALREVVQRKITAEEARKRGITVDVEELQRAADVFRSVNNLDSKDATESWLKDRGLTLDALEDYLETNLLVFKLKQALLQEADPEKYRSHPAVMDVIKELAYAEWLAKHVG
ncbi:MAG: hypothetical protein ACOY46_02570 [Bacillota bacterium]